MDVRYDGVVIGRSTQVRDWTASGAFVGLREPMPVGTPLRLEGEGIDQTARVVDVVESADPAVAGVRVRFGDTARGGHSGSGPADDVSGVPGTALHEGETGEAGGVGGSGRRRRRRR